MSNQGEYVDLIPFNRPAVGTSAAEYVRLVLEGGHHSGDGPFTLRASAMLREIHNSPSVLLTTSCTHALEMAAMLLDIEPGDEVIIPSFTFVSTANAFALRGATIVWADIDAATLSLDVEVVASLINSRTRAVIVVHYAGLAPDMDRLAEVCRERNVSLIEDNAHGLFGSYNDRALGTFGDLSTLSFHETKNISAGEGGALVINNVELLERAEILREKGTNRSQFFRGAVDKYTWVDIGSSYLPAEVIAAILSAALEDSDRTQFRRLRVCDLYRNQLSGWASASNTRLPVQLPGRVTPGHMFYLVFDDSRHQLSFISHMRKQGIMCVFHYVPLHSSPIGLRHPLRASCRNTEAVSTNLVRLPLFAGISDEQVERVVEAAISYE